MATTDRDRLIEAGRKLASQREDLIAQGVHPSLLSIPKHPDDQEDRDGDS